MISGLQAVKRILLGRTMATDEMGHTLLPKVIALPVFSSDALSSVAYATQEILLVLGLAGAVAINKLFPIAIAVAALLALVVVSYRQTVRAYPNGGGAYIVSRENLGDNAGLLAAAALLIDYVLTVSVSITAGTEAVLTAAPGLSHYKIEIAMVFIAFVAMINLRGVKESGVFFAVPTYLFIASIAAVMVTGFVKCLGGCPVGDSAATTLHVSEQVGWFLILRAFAAGTTALTGVEAISNGVPAFRYPQSRNAATTLTIMGTISISMFIGVSWLAQQMGIRYVHGQETSVLGEIAHAAFGGGVGFYVVQIATAAILILAANTAFADFPRLSSILATDRFMPRQLMNRGDRLVFSNGVLILSVVAGVLVVVFRADLNKLIQLYLVGVFVSFTLSQLGMVVHWRKAREPGWRRSIVINGVGATMTGLVLGVVVVTKFIYGAWIVICAIPIVMFLMKAVHKHYGVVAAQLAQPDRLPSDRRRGDNHMLILVTSLDTATARAIGYVRSTRPKSATAMTFERSHLAAWKRLAPDIPISLLERKGRLSRDVRSHVREKRAGVPPADFFTLVVPEVLDQRGLVEIIRRPRLHRLKGALLAEPGVQVLNIPILRAEIDPEVDEGSEPERNYAVVLVAGIHNATLQAIEYAESLGPTNIRAVTFALDPEQSERLGDEWLANRIPVPLELHESPFRDIGLSLTQYVRDLGPEGRSKVVTVIIPEFVVKRFRHQLLHGQTALLVKRHLLFEPGVVVASVPYHLDE